MERSTLALAVLLGVLIIGSLLMNEGFVDASGTDVSGGFISLSLRDLVRLLAGTTPSPAPSTSSTTIIQPPSTTDTLDSQFYSDLRGKIVRDVRKTVREQLQKDGAGSQTVLTDSCIDSVANQQGSDWMRYIPGKNPADYVRKDSIPCYACSLP